MSKPDLSEFMKPPGSLDDFLEGGAADAAGRRRRPPVAVQQKIFRLRWDTCEALRDAVARASEVKGRRTTETELVERLIRKHLKLDV